MSLTKKLVLATTLASVMMSCATTFNVANPESNRRWSESSRLQVNTKIRKPIYVRLIHKDYVQQMDSLAKNVDLEESYMYLYEYNLAVEVGYFEKPGSVRNNMKLISHVHEQVKKSSLDHTHPGVYVKELSNKLPSEEDLQFYIKQSLKELHKNSDLELNGGSFSAFGYTYYYYINPNQLNKYVKKSVFRRYNATSKLAYKPIKEFINDITTERRVLYTTHSKSDGFETTSHIPYDDLDLITSQATGPNFYIEFIPTNEKGELKLKQKLLKKK